jgi:hypothetical protein
MSAVLRTLQIDRTRADDYDDTHLRLTVLVLQVLAYTTSRLNAILSRYFSLAQHEARTSRKISSNRFFSYSATEALNFKTHE